MVDTGDGGWLAAQRSRVAAAAAGRLLGGCSGGPSAAASSLRACVVYASVCICEMLMSKFSSVMK